MRKRNSTILLIVFIGIGFVFGASSEKSIEAGVSVQQITQACLLIVQVDSFLAAASIVGFFQFYGRLLDTFSVMTRSISRAKAKEPKTTDVSKSAEAARKAIADARVSLLHYEAVIVVLFVVSGVLAVGAIFTSNPYDVPAALISTVFAVSLMLYSWVTLETNDAEIEAMVSEVVETWREESKPKPEIRFRNARVDSRDNAYSLYFQAVNEGKEMALNFLIRGKIIGEWSEFRTLGLPVGYAMQPISLPPHTPIEVLLGTIVKGQGNMVAYADNSTHLLALNRRYEIELQYVYLGIQPHTSRELLTVDAQENNPSMKIEMIP